MACVSDPLLVAAIDFGTTFSGYAFQTKSDFKQDPIRIQGFTWTTGSNAGLSNKTPTCVLFNPSKEFDSFGIEAEDKYIQLKVALNTINQTNKSKVLTALELKQTPVMFS